MVLNRGIRGEERSRYRSLLDALALTPREDVPFGRLSAGEKKKAVVALALVKNLPVLILNEPFQDLDEASFRFLHRFLARCADEGRTVTQTVHRDREILPGMQILTG